MMAENNIQGDYRSWYKSKRKANNKKRVVQFKLQYVTHDVKDQDHDCETIITTNNVPSKPLNFYKTKF
jgi:hypothetical protein